MKRFYSHGKLLLTGEYVVLDGAIALAVPSIYGQYLEIKKGKDNRLKWISLDENGMVWLEVEFKFNHNEITPIFTPENDISNRLLQILKVAKQLNPNFLTTTEGYQITTTLEFPKNWGLGTSSTLIANVANWAKVDAYTLLDQTFGGSGYDISCAEANGSLTFQLKKNEISRTALNDKKQLITAVDFNPIFKDHIYFVHLNKKQNSRDGIKQYRENSCDMSTTIDKINAITIAMLNCESLSTFQKLMDDHEALISEVIKETPIKTRLFSNFKGSIKSLGAWGGDFVMVASKDNPTAYFEAKGFTTILPYTKMVLQST
ncbi:GYDIA family GHMP kinase [Psychroserpens damuponensis]|uniref:GYDIA family GHMP kinase n=1 Tax=Psychroserpens damuponensis TaxID=943936 RepID=UPI00058DD142|nr:GYDIA family GHMP kinase [Psychroserpens damuponensis]